MKTVLFASAVAALFATTAVAGDFDANSVTLQFNRDNLQVETGVVAGELTDLTVGAYVLPHTVLGADADVFASLNYGVVTEDLTLAARYGLQKELNAQLTAYGSLEAAYTVSSGSTDGAWAVTPLAGASYRLNDQLAAFGEVSYEFDASNDWASEGGLIEVGADYTLTSGVFIRPSITRSFDTAADETNAALTVGLAF